MVQRAVVQVLQPYLDCFLDLGCLGFRPGVDINKAVALAERLAVEGERWTWVPAVRLRSEGGQGNEA